MKLSKKDRLFSKAREHLLTELDVVALLRSIRFFNTAISSMQLSPYKINQLQQASARLILKSDSEMRDEFQQRQADPVSFEINIEPARAPRTSNYSYQEFLKR